MSLDEEFQRSESVDGDAVGSGDESEEVLLLFVAQTVQEVPQLSE